MSMQAAQVKRNRADHIHACRRKEFAARTAGRHSAGSKSVPVQYCFLCFKWFDGGDDWEEHCRGHLNSMTPKWCAIRVYCHTLISPGFCPYCLGNNGPASQRLRQWTRNCTLMAHVEQQHVEQVCLWPTTCPCGTEVEDASTLRHHLSDAHGLWKAEWRIFGRKRAPEDDEETINPASTLSLQDAGQTRPCKNEKRAKIRGKFIEWSPSRKEQSPNPPTSRTKASNRRKVSQKLVSTRTTSIEWSPAAKAGSSNLASSQHGGLDTREPAILAPSSPKHYPELDWDSPSVTVIYDEEPPDGQALLEQPPRIHDRSDSFLPGDSTDDEFWLDDVSWTENSITDPTSVSIPVTDIGPDTFEDVLDPALFCSEGSISQPLTSEHSHDINTPRSDEEDELDLPSLESLLRRTPVPPSSKPDRELGHGELTESTIRIQEWKEIVGPDGTPILEELPEHELETPAPRTNDTEKEQWLMTGRAPGKPMSAPHNRLAPKASSRAAAKRLRRGAQARRIPKKRTKRLDTREQAELEEAETEWAQRGYPKIRWQRFSSRLQKFSPALRGVLNGNSPSFYRTELESAIARKEDRKYRCMENSTAGYYGPRGQQIL